jgi:hypothetical protein
VHKGKQLALSAESAQTPNKGQTCKQQSNKNGQELAFL